VRAKTHRAKLLSIVMIDTQLVLTVAARAGVCQRTAHRALQGYPVKGLAGGRVRRALEELGLAHGAGPLDSPAAPHATPMGISHLGPWR
jgi:hypothetical protein